MSSWTSCRRWSFAEPMIVLMGSVLVASLWVLILAVLGPLLVGWLIYARVSALRSTAEVRRQRQTQQDRVWRAGY